MEPQVQGAGPPPAPNAVPTVPPAPIEAPIAPPAAAPEPLAANRPKKIGPGSRRNRVGHIKKEFRPEDDPQFSCCIKLNLHRSVIVISAIMIAAFLGQTIYLLFFVQVTNDDLGNDKALAFLVMIGYGCLLVGSILRIKQLYWAFAVFSVCAYAVILWAAIEALETATYMLLGNLRQFPNEEKQFANTRQGLLILAYLLFLSFSVSLHCYFFYIFWRDYNFICEYPRKKQTAAEDKMLLKEE